MLSKLSFLFLPIKNGSPKYFSYCWTTGTPSACFIDSCISGVVDLLKKRVVLSRFICCSNALSYVPNISNHFWQSLFCALQKIRLSSAKRRWVSLGPLQEMETPLISPKSSAFFNMP